MPSSQTATRLDAALPFLKATPSLFVAAAR